MVLIWLEVRMTGIFRLGRKNTRRGWEADDPRTSTLDGLTPSKFGVES